MTSTFKRDLDNVTVNQHAKVVHWTPFNFTRYNLLSNRFDNRLDVCLHDAAGLTTGCIV